MSVMISVVGKSGSGKTTLIEKLIPELKRRGYRIGTIKHAAHVIDMDKKGKDSWRHRNAGADTVVVAGPASIAMVKNCSGAVLDDMVRFFDDVDLIITEGYKSADRPKIEIFRRAAHREPLCARNSGLVALVSDDEGVCPEVPSFGLEDVAGLADFIENTFLKSE